MASPRARLPPNPLLKFCKRRDGWSRQLVDAEVLTDEAHADLRLIEAAQQTGEVVGAYLADVDTSGDAPAPAHFREAFRAKGPSNYAHGKQTELN